MFAARNCSRQARLLNAARVRPCRGIRLQSTASGQSSSSGTAQSHMLAGLAGGAVVVLAGYGYYHFSGTKKVIDSAKALKVQMVQTKDKLVEKTPEPKVILQYLRSTAKAYAGFLPGAGEYVDTTFDSIDQLADSHNEEFNSILTGAYEELRPVLKNGSLDQGTAMQVFSIIRKRTLELQDLSVRAGSDFFGPILDKHPELKEKLGGSYDQVRKLASEAGPEAGRIAKDTASKLKDTFKDGFDNKQIEQAKQILQEAAERLQKASGKAGVDVKEAWNKSMQQAQPYLDKVPEIKELLNSKASVLMSGAGAKQIWDRVKEVGSQGNVSKEKVEELKSFIQEKASGTADSSGDLWDKVLEYSKGIPGSEKLDDKREKLKGFVAVVREDSEDAKQLARETFDDIVNVLDGKAEKAKKLKEKAKGDAEKTGKENK